MYPGSEAIFDITHPVLRCYLVRLVFLPWGFIGFSVTGEGGVRGWRLGEQRGDLALGRAVILQGRWQRALVAVLVVELVVPLEDELARSQRLRGGLRGRLVDRLGLAELPGEVAGAGRLGRAQGGGDQGGVDVRESGGGLEALVSFLCFFS